MRKLKSILTTALVGTLGIAVIGFGVWAATSASVAVTTNINTPTEGFYGVLNGSIEGCQESEGKTYKKVLAFDKDEHEDCEWVIGTLDFISNTETGAPMDIVISFNMTLNFIGTKVSQVEMSVEPDEESGWAFNSQSGAWVYGNLLSLTFDTSDDIATPKDKEISIKATISYIGNGAVSDNAIGLAFMVYLGPSS